MLSLEINAADVDANGTIFAGHEDGLYQSTDGGVTWTNIYTVPGTPTIIRRVFCDSSGYIFVSAFDPSSDWGLYRSTNGGASFTKVLTLDTNCCIWGFDEDSNGYLYAGEYSRLNAGKSQIWKSTDGGATWVQKYINDLGAGSQDHIHDLRVDPNTDWIYATCGDATTNNLLRSKDAGETWSVVNTGPTNWLALAIGPDGYIYVGTDTNGTGNVIYKFQDSGGATVTPTLSLALPTGQDNDVYCGGEYGGKVFFGVAGNSTENKFWVYDGSVWTAVYSQAIAAGFRGFDFISRHHNNGAFYLANRGGSGIRFQAA